MLNDHVAEIDTDAKRDAPLFGHVSVLLRHGTLDLGGACDGVNDARKLDEHPITGALDDTSLVLRDLRVEKLLAKSIEGGKRHRLVDAHQAAEADHVGR